MLGLKQLITFFLAKVCIKEKVRNENNNIKKEESRNYGNYTQIIVAKGEK